uniref:uncharacterized protein LOC122593623 n=1 Tax=Erigeron canadensis TaxID=72917 RepID=UPI001CB88F40|nr:uncharacterized protein LOC122593623 [Erigeron canadensis]
MGKATTRIQMSHRVLSPSYNYNYAENNPNDQPAIQLSGSIFGFLEDENTIFSSLESQGYSEIQQEFEDEDEIEKATEGIEDKVKFWETQHTNLHTTLYRTTSLESKIRTTTKQAIAELEAAENNVCSCLRPISTGCRSCRMTEICRRLQDSGYNSAICKSKWKSSFDIPSGEHTFVDVIDHSNCKKGEVRVIIELEFRGQFEMKKGSVEYNDLVSKLPDVFVGKIERLQNIVKILSNAAKRCMKEKKMHLGPWRKQRYVEAKWLRVVERTTSMALNKPLMVDNYYFNSPVSTKARASMLTMDLVDHNLPKVHNYYAPVVEVL